MTLRSAVLVGCLVLGACHEDADVSPGARAEAVPPGSPAPAPARLRASLAEEQYRFVATPAAIAATNPAHGLDASFDARGWRLGPRRGDAPAEWRLELALDGVGRASARDGADLALAAPAPGVAPSLGDCDGTARVGATGRCLARLEYRRPGLLEYVRNLPVGLEHGYVVDRRPDGDGDWLAIASRVQGLRARLAPDGQTVRFVDASGVRVVYGHLAVLDADGRRLEARLALSPDDRLLVLARDAGAVYPVHVDPLAASPVWVQVGAAADDRFAFSLAPAGDVNGDGLADLIVGAPGAGGGAGAAYVFEGASSGVEAFAAWTVAGASAADACGHAVAPAGDVNADGYADVLVGCPGFNGDQGKAWLFRGSSLGIPPGLPAWTGVGEAASYRYGEAVTTTGDRHRDGVADFAIGAPGYGSGAGAVYRYRGTTASTVVADGLLLASLGPAARFGAALAGGADVNGDGTPDLVIGAPGYDSGRGAVSMPGGQRLGESIGDHFGAAVALAGDVDGDGFADVLVGAPDRGSGTGKAYLYRGTALGVAASAHWSRNGTAAGAALGASLSSAGDVNGDGYADIVVGAPGSASVPGEATVFAGAAAGPAATPFWTTAVGGGLGIAVGSAGDVNGDGLVDVAVGVPGEDAVGLGRVYLARPEGFEASADWSGDGAAPSTALGLSVAAADVTGDGFGDVILHDGSASNPSSAHVFAGSAGGLAPTAATSPALFQGGIVAPAGDVNGDGYGDVVAGSPDAWGSRGVVRLLTGTSTGALPTLAAKFGGDGERLGASAAGIGDEDDDGHVDVLVGAPSAGAGSGQVLVLYGPDWGRVTSTPSPVAGGAFGAAMAAAGDVDGDGYPDYLVGAPAADGGRGRVYLYTREAYAEPYDPPGAVRWRRVLAWTLVGEAAGDDFGRTVAGAGDVDGDGLADVLVGAPLAGAGAGRAYLYRGGAVTPAGPFVTIAGTAGESRGAALGAAGDVDGDGFGDVIVGAPGAGAASVYLGPDLLAEVELVGASGDGFGRAVGPAGDVNGDGYGDVIVGVPDRSSGAGGARVFLGGPGGASTLLPRQAPGTVDRLLQPGGRTDGDLRLLLRPHTAVGRSLVRLQWEIKPTGQPFDGTGLESSTEWTDTSSPTWPGVEATVAGLPGRTSYHWRARLLHAGGGWTRWVHFAGGGQNLHLRTPAAALGTPCTTGDPCQPVAVPGYPSYAAKLGQCVDGVCCSSPCDLTCYSCLASDTGLDDGLCAPITPGPDPACDDSFACSDDACAASGACLSTAWGCEIEGSCVSANDLDPANSCRTCTPWMDRYAYVPRADGESCATDSLACTLDACDAGVCGHTVTSGCLIDGACVAALAPAPGNGCLWCAPSTSTGAWSPVPAGVACPDDGVPYTDDVCDGAGACTHPGTNVCVIDGVPYVGGTVDPADPCRICDVAASPVAWTQRPAGTPCAPDALACTRDVCQADGACAHPLASGCLIGGLCVAADASDPASECSACQPHLATGAYTPRPAGVACADDGLAHTADACDGAGACVHTVSTGGCDIGGVAVAAGAANPANECQACDATTPLEWTDRVAGYPCADDALPCTAATCDGAGTCAHSIFSGCLIDGACVAADASDPTSECAACQPHLAADAYTARPAGVACDSDGLAHTVDLCDGAGGCAHPSTNECVIDGVPHVGGAVAPHSPCLVCDVTASQVEWTVRPPGTPCPDDGLACTSDVCGPDAACHHPVAVGCLIDGACVAADAPGPTSECSACQPHLAADAYTARPHGVACADDGEPTTADWCDGAGACSHPPNGTCFIGGASFAAGEANPANACEACAPAAPATWTDRVAGHPCDDDGLPCTLDACDGAGGCAHELRAGCLIDGACVAADAPDPASPCRACQPHLATDAYTARPAGVACADDGLACTDDACDGAGACAHPLARGCLVDGACVAWGAPDPDNVCRWCVPWQSDSGWSDLPEGTACVLADPAGQIGACQAGTCQPAAPQGGDDGGCSVPPGRRGARAPGLPLALLALLPLLLLLPLLPLLPPRRTRTRPGASPGGRGGRRAGGARPRPC